MAARTPLERSSATRAQAALMDVLPRSVQVTLATSGARADLRIGDTPLQLEWAGEGNLGDVVSLLQGGRPDVVAARRLSPGARAVLSREGVGWVDETGAAEIVIGSIIVSRSGRPVAPIVRPPGWAPATLAIAEALLCGTPATVEEVVAATGLSTGSCSNGLRALTELGLLTANAKRGRGSGRRVENADQLLAAYAIAAESLRVPLCLRVGVDWPDAIVGLVEAGRRWTTARVSWVATGTVAASAIAPQLKAPGATEVYVDADTIARLETIAADANFRPAASGSLTLRPVPTVSVRRLATDVGGLRVAPWPRVYVDLRSVGATGEEAAEKLLEIVRRLPRAQPAADLDRGPERRSDIDHRWGGAAAWATDPGRAGRGRR